MKYIFCLIAMTIPHLAFASNSFLDFYANRKMTVSIAVPTLDPAVQTLDISGAAVVRDEVRIAKLGNKHFTRYLFIADGSTIKDGWAIVVESVYVSDSGEFFIYEADRSQVRFGQIKGGDFSFADGWKQLTEYRANGTSPHRLAVVGEDETNKIEFVGNEVHVQARVNMGGGRIGPNYGPRTVIYTFKLK